jgi:hypothetical protein
MKLYTSIVLVTVVSWMAFTACTTTTPEKYFGIAVLNTNMIHGFSDEKMYRELEQPSVKLVEGTRDQTEPQKRMEMLTTKIRFLEENFSKLQALKPTPETRDMIRASVELYEYVLPVYKTEYTQLAKSFDENVPREQIEQLALALHNKYNPGFNERMNKLIELGKKYAEDNSIPVRWGVGQMN